MTRGDLIRFIERGIEEGATQEVSASARTDAVTVQTIHAAKGLEYPIVVLANMNRYRFPPSRGGGSVVSFDDPIGLRQRKVYADAHGYPHVYDNWHADVLRACLPNEYDEERRLLYVAMTRAEHHLVFTAGAEPNTFLEELPVAVEEVEPDLEEGGPGETVQTEFNPPISPPEGPVGLSARDLMDDGVHTGSSDGRGVEFGSKIHDFAEAYAEGKDAESEDDNPDWEHVMKFLDGLAGDVRVEQQILLPVLVDDTRVAISGVVDLVHLLPDRVEVVDFKTDLDQATADEYGKQVSVYYHVLDACYPVREVDVSLFYTAEDEIVSIDPPLEWRVGSAN